MLRILLGLLLPLLVACRVPVAGVNPPPPAVEKGVAPPSRIAFTVEVSSGLRNGPALEAELSRAFAAELAGWGAEPADPSAPGALAPLKVRLEAHEEREVLPPFYYLGIPGIASAGAGVAILQAGAGAQEMGALPYALFGGAFLGLGVAGIAVGAAMGGRQLHHDRRRGYPLHPIKVVVVCTLPRLEDGDSFKEIYRTRSLASATRPLAAAEVREPGVVRREMFRALAAEVRADMARHYAWKAGTAASPDR